MTYNSKNNIISESMNQSSNKHLYHNLYSSPTKQDFKTFIPPLPNNNNNNNNNNLVALNENKNYENTSIIPDIQSSPIKQNKIKKPKICKVCSKPIIGTLVRAMDNIYHVNCFTCYDCNKPCSDKFFAADIKIKNSNSIINIPLCEYDYFKRINLICFNCDNAIRGSYITALGNKYHSEHFFCEICHKVFESDNYYANNNKIYCHFHYSKLYAYHCQGCKCSILKQYVEIYKGDKRQQWHPECFMVHKFWNVDITVNSLGLNINSIDEISSNPDKLFKVETNLEKLTISIWLTLSEFEESCALLISEMLHNATINNKIKGLLITSKLIFKIKCLFKSIESLTNFSTLNHILIDYDSPNYQSFSKLIKEPRSLTSKIMSYLTFLRDIDIEKLNITKYSQELLSLISIIAHFIKLISRIALIHALEFNKLSNSLKPTDILLNEISKHENYSNDYLNLNIISNKSNDLCSYCNKSIEEACIMFQINESIEKRWHIDCFFCSKCPNHLKIDLIDLNDSGYNIKNDEILCPSCASADVNAKQGFLLISRFMQLAYLLEIAMKRSKIVINKRERKNQLNQSNDVNISSNNQSNQQKRDKQQQQQQQQEIILSSKSSKNDSYENKVTEITRRRSLREARTLSNANHEIRKSVILEAPIAWSADTEEITESKFKTEKNLESSIIRDDSADINEFLKNSRTHIGTKGSMKLRVKDISSNNKNNNKYLNNKSSNDKNVKNNLRSKNGSLNENQSPLNAALTSRLLKNESSLTLDDIPRIVNSEQARDHRPNAFRFQRRDYSSVISTLPIPKSVKDNNNNKNDNNLNLNSDSDSNIDKQKIYKSSEKPILINNNNNNNNNILLQQLPKNKSTDKILKDLTTKVNSISVSGKRYSELNNISHEYIRHIAAFALYDLFSNKMTLEESLGLIDIYKPTSFWGKLFGNSNNNNNNSNLDGSFNNHLGEFKSGSATISGSGKGVFGVPLITLVSKYGVESDLGIGSNKVRIPLLIDELISVMRNQDVSAEGVFRLNGNIKRLRQLVEEIDQHPDHAPNLVNETPIQLAALLKKFLRDLPIPLLTFKLYDLFLFSQRLGANNIDNTEEEIKFQRKRERILKLAYAMLPKAHRDLAEVLFAFLSWVSTFANVEEEDNVGGGSKMDTHNLATVITPNILYTTKFSLSSTNDKKDSPNDALGLLDSVGGENQFLAIEVINEMIELNDELSIIPEDLVHIYKLAGFDKKSDNNKEKEKDRQKTLLTKDIISKLKNIVESNPGVLSQF
jgi:hypothetical protein